MRDRDGLYAADLLAFAISHLDFFSWLGEVGAATTDAICRHFKVVERPVDVLLTLCRAKGFVVSDEKGSHRLTPVAREHLVRESPYFLGAYYDSMRNRPVARDYESVFRSGKPANWASQADRQDWHQAMLEEAFAKEFTAAMNCRGLALGQALARKVSPLFDDRRHVLDVGGGSGIYAATLLARYARLTATVLEQAPVDAIARQAVADYGLGDRIDVQTANMFSDPWPPADAVLLSNVLHDWDVPEVRRILERCADCLPEDGLVLIHEVFIDDDKCGPLPAAEYSALLMQVTQGKCYTPSEYGALLAACGFQPGAYQSTLGDRGFVTARRSGGRIGS